jgi:Flp pilus assembly protein TadD
VPTAVTCAACGATIRADRPKCLRCGAPLQAAVADAARGTREQASRPDVRYALILAAVLGSVALGGFALSYVGRPVNRTPAPTAAVSTAPAVMTPAAAPRDASTTRLDPAVVAVDARRAGAAAYSSGDILSAIDRLREAVEANPNDPGALNDLGQALVRGNRPDSAIQYFDRAVALAPNTWAYHFNRARAYAQMKQWSQAVAGYREASRLFPDDYATEYNLGRALQAAGDLAGAIGAFEHAIALAPGQADFHLSHGLALEAAKRARDAVNAYRRYLELEPASPDAEKVKAHIAQLEGLKS